MAKKATNHSDMVKVTNIRPLMIARHSSDPAYSGSANSGIDVVSIQEMIARNARDFLLQNPTKDNRFAFYRLLELMDPEVMIARNYLALMIQRSYLGPRLDESDEGYTPTPDFLHNVNIILSEIQFASRIGALAKDLIRHGNAFLRFRRLDMSMIPEEEFRVKQIEVSEIIPPDAMTILSERYLSDPKEFKGIISTEDYYVIAEKKDRKGAPYQVIWEPSEEPQPDKEGKPPEIVLPARDVLHIAWDAEGSQFEDSFGRSTYNIWGQSIYESIILYVKAKLAITTDYVRWMRMGMPRWIMNMNMDDILRLDSYPGTIEEKTKKAIEAAQEIMWEFESQLYYYDNNRESPTYRKKLPIEPDETLVLSDKCNLEQKGGASSPDPAVMNFLKECNRAISSAMGVPLILFNYNEGNTYATSKISAKFLAGYGGGLLRTIEIDTKEMLQKEFEYRGWEATAEDWENLYLEYDRDDTEELQSKNNVDLIRANAVLSLSGAAKTLYEGGIVTLNQARMIMREGLDALKNLGDMEGGDTLKPLQPVISPATGMFAAPKASPPVYSAATPKEPEANPPEPMEELMGKLNLKKDEPDMEEGVKKALSDAFVFFIEDIAKKVEAGKVRGGGKA